jgi:hypothetical protein
LEFGRKQFMAAIQRLFTIVKLQHACALLLWYFPFFQNEKKEKKKR